MTATNRPDYFEQTLRSWVNARNIDDWKFTIYLEPTNRQDRMIELAKSYLDAEVVVNESIYGVLTNPWQALDKSFSQGSPFTILAEDDVIVSTDVLEYFEYCMDQKLENTIGACAYSESYEPTEGKLIRIQRHFSPWVWGTWKTTWDNLLRDSWFVYAQSEDLGRIGWDWGMTRLIHQKKLWFLTPDNSRSDHIGQYGGTHMSPKYWRGPVNTFILERPSTGKFVLAEDGVT